MRCFVVALLLGTCFAGTGLAGAGAQAADIAAHRAHYDLHLERGRGDVVAASGTMDFEITDACDAWAVRQRLRMQLTGRDGTESNMLSDYTTLESKDGGRLRFQLRQTNDGQVSEEIQGVATLSATGGEAKYTLPEVATKTLPAGTLLPMAHTNAVLTAAASGQKFVAVPLFDGTSADGAQNSTIVVASWDKAGKSDRPELAGIASGRVRIAFFNRESGAPQAEYEVGMRYFENGVADEMSMDFGDFVMAAKMTQLSVAKPGC